MIAPKITQIIDYEVSHLAFCLDYFFKGLVIVAIYYSFQIIKNIHLCNMNPVWVSVVLCNAAKMTRL